MVQDFEWKLNYRVPQTVLSLAESQIEKDGRAWIVS